MARRHNGGRKKRVKIFCLAARSFTCGAVAAADLVRTEIFCTVQGDGNVSAKLPEGIKPAALFHHAECGVENRKEVRRFNRVQHGADLVVTRDARHLEQRLAVGPPVPGAPLKETLMG